MHSREFVMKDEEEVFSLFACKGMGFEKNLDIESFRRATSGAITRSPDLYLRDLVKIVRGL